MQSLAQFPLECRTVQDWEECVGNVEVNVREMPQKVIIREVQGFVSFLLHGCTLPLVSNVHGLASLIVQLRLMVHARA